MGIFIKRPLCLFCFCFIAASAVACNVSTLCVIYGFAVSLIVSLCLLILSFIFKRRKYGLIEAFIALIFAALAFAVSFLSIHLPSYRQDKLCSEQAKVKFLVIEEEYNTKYSSEYTGKILLVGEEYVYIDGTLSCSYEGEYSMGDCLWLIGNVEKGEDTLVVTPTIDRETIVSKRYDNFDINLLSVRITNAVKDILRNRLDYDRAALASGLLTGNKKDVSPQMIRDFRRSGLSHVLAVSGLHLAVILGAIEFVLKRIGISKLIRCIILSLASVGLLVLAGFSPSACRSVLMLMCAYLCFTLSRESDALTSLGFAGFLILFLSPKTVLSLSFWLSFLATFGLVTWLSIIPSSSSVTRRPRSIWLRGILRIGLKIWSAVSIAFCANISICIISWLFFGELSVIGILANVVVTPLCVIYLVIALLIVCLGWIPFVREVLAFATDGLYRLIKECVAFFSGFDFSTVSLRYPFAGLIVVSMSAAMLILLIVRLKRKSIIACVPVLAIAAFSVCLWSYNLNNPYSRVNYINDGFRDSVVISEKNYATIIDIGDGNYSPLYSSVAQAKENYATYIDSIVLTHYHVKYISSLEKIFRRDIVKRIYLPFPSTEEEADIAFDICRCVNKNGAEFIFYNYKDEIMLSDESKISVLGIAKTKHSERKIISFVYSSDDAVLAYADSSWNTSDMAQDITGIIERSDIVIFGAHGPRRKEEKVAAADIDYPPLIVCSDKEILVPAKDSQPDTQAILPKQHSDVVNLPFLLDN